MLFMLFANFMLQLSHIKNAGTTPGINPTSDSNSLSERTMVGINPGDPNSFSNSHLIRVTHLHLELDVNFEESKLAGVATVSLKKIDPLVKEVVLDARDLNIFKVFDATTQQALEFQLIKDTKAPEFMGQKFVINLPDTTSDTYNISINYETTKKCSALQWLQPEQTAGKKYPYLFSQCEAIHARSMVPCQDTPSVKASYTATISAPKEVTVLMSAVKNGEKENPEKGTRSHSFNQKVPIPSYLIAIVVGALEKRKISERIDVWSEKEMVEKGAYEFAEAETMLQTAEKLVGPYIWGRYDILILPPSFPFGGMENPCLTFVTPTVLAGDRSLADVIAHEISHSWTGNLVTNTNFEHFWLNEGFTVYVERLIDGEMFGEQFRQFKSIGGWKVLLDEIKSQTATGPFTKLVWDLTNEDPDEAFSSVPYEKGFAFLYYLEQVVQGKENFTKFLRDYIDHFKYQSIDSKQMMFHLLKYFPDNEELKAVDFDAWFHNPGLPPVIPQYDQTLEQACIDLSQKWINAKTPADFAQFSIDDIKDLHSAQVQEFLTLIRQNGALPIENLKQMEKVYKFDEVNNCEIKCQWIQLGLLSKWQEITPFAIKFVIEQGRMKYLKPIYRGLYQWEETRQLAIDTFLKHRDEMMYIAVVAVARELHIKP